MHFSRRRKEIKKYKVFFAKAKTQNRCHAKTRRRKVADANHLDIYLINPTILPTFQTFINQGLYLFLRASSSSRCQRWRLLASQR
ncbi:MAG: hypothetical protein JWO03_411 [Bacteroidetes bacterium]|nr:hypothetical protein [Bacteroidota bacterium]